MIPCQQKDLHNERICPFYHSKNDKRRSSNRYSSSLCENYQNCPLEDGCLNCHNKIEFLYHPDNYKKIFCKSFLEFEKCNLEVFCPFIHNENEFQCDLLHSMKLDLDFFMFQYKTVICPFGSKTHDSETCVYAHNENEIRRNPSVFEYGPKECSFGLRKHCPKGNKCKDSHGKFEALFHPMNFKTVICKNENCKIPNFCPLAHHKNDFRLFFV